MERQIAITVQDLCQEGASSIRKSIEVVRGHLPEQEFKAYCLAIGNVLADVQLEVLHPYVYQDFPDLAPSAPVDKDDAAYIAGLKTRFDDAARRAREESDD